MRRPEFSDNPFRPGFGSAPPTLAGREALLTAYEETFVPGAWTRFTATLLVGHRGIGKTTLLTAMEARARAAGWAVVISAAFAAFGIGGVFKLHHHHVFRLSHTPARPLPLAPSTG